LSESKRLARCWQSGGELAANPAPIQEWRLKKRRTQIQILENVTDEVD
jgi:hypothetical protein